MAFSKQEQIKPLSVNFITSVLFPEWNQLSPRPRALHSSASVALLSKPCFLPGLGRVMLHIRNELNLAGSETVFRHVAVHVIDLGFP